MTLLSIFQCPQCKVSIEADSFFCDQCGEEIRCCSVCGRPGNKTFCVYDGNPLIPSKQVRSREPAGGTPPSVSQSVAPAPAAILSEPLEVASLGTAKQPKLFLVNHALNLRVEISSGDFIARNQGPHAQVFTQFPTVSGDRHVLFKYQQALGWCFEDQCSTNGTKHSKGRANWPEIPRASPLTPVFIHHGDRMLIANVEFILEFPQVDVPLLASNATLRL